MKTYLILLFLFSNCSTVWGQFFSECPYFKEIGFEIYLLDDEDRKIFFLNKHLYIISNTRATYDDALEISFQEYYYDKDSLYPMFSRHAQPRLSPSSQEIFLERLAKYGDSIWFYPRKQEVIVGNAKKTYRENKEKEIFTYEVEWKITKRKSLVVEISNEAFTNTYLRVYWQNRKKRYTLHYEEKTSDPNSPHVYVSPALFDIDADGTAELALEHINKIGDERPTLLFYKINYQKWGQIKNLIKKNRLINLGKK